MQEGERGGRTYGLFTDGLPKNLKGTPPWYIILCIYDRRTNEKISVYTAPSTTSFLGDRMNFR